MPEAAILAIELQGFKYSISPSGHVRFGNDESEWRENSHDVLVLALAVGVWWGENGPKPVLLRPPLARSLWAPSGNDWD